MLYLCRGRVGTKFCNGAGVLHDVQNTRDCLPTMHCIVNGAGVRAGLRSSELPPRNPCTPLPPAPPLVGRERESRIMNLRTIFTALCNSEFTLG